MRPGESLDLDRPLNLLYEGDYYPSGLQMSEVDLSGRLADGGNAKVTRLALTLDDCLDNRLPGFAADTKRGDSRWRWFSESYGERCWELDALPPPLLRAKVERATLAIVDLGPGIEPEAWQNGAASCRASGASTLSIVERGQNLHRQVDRNGVFVLALARPPHHAANKWVRSPRNVRAHFRPMSPVAPRRASSVSPCSSHSS